MRLSKDESIKALFEECQRLKFELAESDARVADADRALQIAVKETVLDEAKLLQQMAKAMYAVHRRLEFYTEREVSSPSNHQEFAREAQEELAAFNNALTMYNEWAKVNPAAAQSAVEEARKKVSRG